MKKLLLSLALSLGTLSAAPAMAAAPAFSASQMAQIKITDLSFKNVMRQFYSGQMFDIHVDDMEDTPYIGLGKYDDTDSRTLGIGNYDDTDRATIALMHPIIQYKNTAGEDRYLIIIEKTQVSDGTIYACRICAATADMYSFKKLSNDQFQLVSRTPRNVEFSASWGRVGLSAEDIQDGMQPLGKDLVGSIFMNGYNSTGITESWWEVLNLPENAYINLYILGNAGLDNSGKYDEDSPLHYDYKVTFKVLPENATYYPIMLTYKGKKPTNDYERIEPVNYSKIVKFNPTKKAYE